MSSDPKIVDRQFCITLNSLTNVFWDSKTAKIRSGDWSGGRRAKNEVGRKDVKNTFKAILDRSNFKENIYHGF